MRQILDAIAGILLLGLMAAAPALAAEPDLNGQLNLDACQCQRGPDGLCRRWLRPDLHWQLYASGPADADVTADDLEHAIIEAFGAWQSQRCNVCATSGTLPDLPKDVTDPALARPYGATGCIATACDANPLGLDFAYGGRALVPALASDCGGMAAADCPGAAVDSAQIAFLRNDDHWGLSQFAVTATYLTTAHDGHILDADILLRNTTHVFCYSKCVQAQWDVRAALIVELGNAIGMGAAAGLPGSPTPETTPAGEAAKLPTYVPPALSQCACLAYRFSTHPDMCLPPDNSFSCDAGPQKPLPHAPNRWPWLLLLAPCLLVVRRWRQRKGVSSAVPQRRA